MGPDPRRRIPSGYASVRSFPVVHVESAPPLDLATWDLRIGGAVERPFSSTWEEFRRLPHAVREADFHCVQGFSRLGNRWEGVLLRDMLARAAPRPGGRFVRVTDGRRYDTTIPLEVAMRNDVMLADVHDGRPLDLDHGAPVRLVVPAKLAWKSCKWVRTIEVLERDRLGFWESRGYSNDADPFAER